MAKGFGVKPIKQLGYVLMVFPSAKAYAARLDFDDGSGQEFIGVTNMLKSAQVWKTKKQAQEAIVKYADFLIEQASDDTEVRIDIRRLNRDSSGHLTDEPIESLVLVSKDVPE
ncbi:hypothetical protein [Nostoc sp.]